MRILSFIRIDFLEMLLDFLLLANRRKSVSQCIELKAQKSARHAAQASVGWMCLRLGE